MKKNVIIIGGGLAGLSAAIYSLRNGYRPVIIEKNRYLGGRVRSFWAKDVQSTLDNGQHVLSAAYRETFDLLRILRTRGKIHTQQRFFSMFISGQSQKFLLKSAALPSPFHLLLPLLKNRKNTRIKLLDFLTLGQKLFRLQIADLEDLTVNRWLDHLKQSPQIRRVLWEPLTISIMNTQIQEASAYLFYQAIRQSFLSSGRSAGLALPKDWLGNIFNIPAEKYITENGGKIHLLSTVKKFNESGGNISSIQTIKGEFSAPFFISAVPPHALTHIFESSGSKTLQENFPDWQQFEYNPIITINLYLQTPLNLQFPATFIDSPLQWIFPHPQKRSDSLYGYAVVISAANDLATCTTPELLKIVRQEFLRLLAINLDAPQLVKFKIIKEKRATISQTPSAMQLRVGTRSPIRNLFWAGDWTDTGLPATIESAVLSGRLAAEALKKTDRSFHSRKIMKYGNESFNLTNNKEMS